MVFILVCISALISGLKSESKYKSVPQNYPFKFKVKRSPKNLIRKRACDDRNSFFTGIRQEMFVRLFAGELVVLGAVKLVVPGVTAGHA